MVVLKSNKSLDVRAKQRLSYRVAFFPSTCVVAVSPHVNSTVGHLFILNVAGRKVMKNLMRFLLIGVVVAGFNSVSWTQSQTLSNSATTDKDVTQLKNLLERVGERIQKYQDAMFSIAFTEVLRQQVFLFCSGSIVKS